MTIGELKKLLDAYPEEWIVLTDAYEGGQDVPELFQVASVRVYDKKPAYQGRWIVENTFTELENRLDDDYGPVPVPGTIKHALLISCRFLTSTVTWLYHR